VLAQVHALLVAMLRGNPVLILDSCSVRAKRAGELTGPNPTDRGKRGTKYHVAVTGDGIPVACAATAANVNDTLVFERLFLSAFAVMVRIETCSPTRGMMPSTTTASCAEALGPSRTSTSGGRRPAQAWAGAAGRWSAATPGCWRTSALPCATTGWGSSSKACFRPPAYSWLQAGSRRIVKTAS
jgi:Transposase DDE domain